jgi:hypothetical protein
MALPPFLTIILFVAMLPTLLIGTLPVPLRYTLGLGGKFKDFGLDLSYLIPNKQNEVLSNTFRVSLNYCPFK